MNPIVQQLIDKAFGGGDTTDKSSLLRHAQSLPLPDFMRQKVQELPDGQVSRGQVERELGGEPGADDVLRRIA
jgi:hypothetical protein